MLEIPKRDVEDHDTRVFTKKFKSGKGFTDLEINSLEIKYTEQPTAVFMVIPDYDPSNHVIGSIFISQLYTELAVNCKETPNKKCFRRVHFILDEFGNMPPIDNMDGIMTVCLGRNILFNLVIQSYTQLNTKYDKGAQTIKENCQNHILIMSNDADTIEEISKKCGHKTIIGRSASAKHMDTDSSVTSSADQERIITPERASQLIEGEQVILRNLHRQDKERGKIRPFPIFNTKSTNMPYRYQFLNDEFDTRRDINEIDIACEHINLSLIDNQIPFAPFIRDLKTRLEYSITNNIPISDEDYAEYSSLPNSQQNLDENALMALRSQKSDEELSQIQRKIKLHLKDSKEHILKLKSLENEVEKESLNKFFSAESVQYILNNRFNLEQLNELNELIDIITKNGNVKNQIVKVKNSLSKIVKASSEINEKEEKVS